MSLLTNGTDFIICVYIAIIYSSLNYYLLTDKKANYSMNLSGYKNKIGFILEIIIAISFFIFPPLLGMAPCVIYDITRSRNYIAFAASVIAIALFFNPTTSILIIILSLVAIVLSIKSEMLSFYYENLKKTRDDSEEINSRLRLQNTELMNAKDTEVYNAQLSERNRIAREIHDNVGHTLSRAILQMGALLAIHKEEPIHTELEGVRETLDSAMNSIRSSVHDLHNDSIDVKASISDMAKPLNDKYSVHLDLDIGDNTPRPVKYALIGVTKECISNIIKHSKNTDVSIKLHEHPSMYQLIIHDYSSDDKMQASPDKAINFSDFGMGLENICGRVESVNGTLNISTDNGFQVFVSIPR